MLGGETNPCPPNADCAVAPADLLRDGAAYDPRRTPGTRSPKRPCRSGLGDRLLSAAGRVLLRHAGQEGGSRLFVYDPAADQWTDIPSFLGDLPVVDRGSTSTASVMDGS